MFNNLGKTSILVGCSLHIQQAAAANYTLLLNAAAFWLQPAVMNFDVFPYVYNSTVLFFHLFISSCIHVLSEVKSV